MKEGTMSTADEIEEWLVARLCVIFNLRREKVGGSFDFDDLGMDSITHAGLAREIENQFDLSLAPDALYEYPTVQALASHIAGP
jgi:acyl carrier protein